MTQKIQEETGEERLLKAIFVNPGIVIHPTKVDAGGKMISLQEVIEKLLNSFPLIQIKGTHGKPIAPGYSYKRVLVLRFGLEGNYPHTLEVIGRKLGKSRNRIWQVEKRALRMLRHPIRSDRLRPFLAQGPP